MTHTVLRIAASLIFLVAGANHLFDPAHVAGRLEAARMGFLATALAPAQALVLAAGVAMLVGGAALALGWRTRLAALGLIAILVPITLTVQVGSWGTVGPLFKNIAILGALVHLAAVGGGPFSLDSWRRA